MPGPRPARHHRQNVGRSCCLRLHFEAVPLPSLFSCTRVGWHAFAALVSGDQLVSATPRKHGTRKIRTLLTLQISFHSSAVRTRAQPRLVRLPLPSLWRLAFRSRRSHFPSGGRLAGRKGRRSCPAALSLLGSGRSLR